MRWFVTATRAAAWSLLSVAAFVGALAFDGTVGLSVSSPFVPGALPVPLMLAVPVVQVAGAVHGAGTVPGDGTRARQVSMRLAFIGVVWGLPLGVAAIALLVDGGGLLGTLLRSQVAYLTIALLVMRFAPRRAWDSAVSMAAGATFLATSMFGSSAVGVSWWAYPLRPDGSAGAADLIVGLASALAAILFVDGDRVEGPG